MVIVKKGIFMPVFFFESVCVAHIVYLQNPTKYFEIYECLSVSVSVVFQYFYVTVVFQYFYENGSKKANPMILIR